MKRIIVLFPALFLALCGSAQNPSKSALEVLDGRNYKLLIEREVVNRWEQPSESFAIGLGEGSGLADKPKANINGQEILVTDHWIRVDNDKLTCRIGDILDYQLAGDGDVNKKNRNAAADNVGIREFEITDYKEVAKKNKRNIDITRSTSPGSRSPSRLPSRPKGCSTCACTTRPATRSANTKVSWIWITRNRGFFPYLLLNII